MNNYFDITIAYYPDRKEPVAEIFYKNIQWCEVSSKEDMLMAQFYSHPKEDNWEFPLEEAIEILEKVKNKLSNKSLFGKVPNEVDEVNQLGQKMLEEIVVHPNAKIYSNRFGGRDIFEPSGRGARFDKQENFLGFLQLR